MVKTTIEIAVQKVAEKLESFDNKALKRALQNADKATTADQQTPIKPEQSAILHRANVRAGRSRR